MVWKNWGFLYRPYRPGLNRQLRQKDASVEKTLNESRKWHKLYLINWKWQKPVKKPNITFTTCYEKGPDHNRCYYLTLAMALFSVNVPV